MASPYLPMSALSLLESPSPSPSPTPSDPPSSLPTPSPTPTPSSSPLPRRRKRKAGLSKRQAADFRAYSASIATSIPPIIQTHLPDRILELHRLNLAFPAWPDTPPSAPDPPLPPYQPATFSPSTKLDPSSYRWKPRAPQSPSLSYHPSNALLRSIHLQYRPVLLSFDSLLHELAHFLHLSLPAFDETSNSALSTPQTVLAAVRRQQRFVEPWLRARVQYLAQRGVMVEACIKYGWEWNHVQALSEWDEREWVRWRNGMRELRGRMLGLYHLLLNNRDKLLQHSAYQLQLT